MIRVLVVEDSAVVRQFLVQLLEGAPDLGVAGTARDGAEAVEAALRLRPDVITMDINMPRLDGFEATRRIMETCPVPIVIVSGSWDTREVATTFRALEAGALAVLPRPSGLGHLDHAATAAEFVNTVRLMSEVKVVRRWPRAGWPAGAPAAPKPPGPARPSPVGVVAIGASTGGPLALQAILTGLPRELAAPLLIVQHIASGFVQGLTEWLARTSGWPVHVAIHEEPLLPGHAYVAPDGLHLGADGAGRVALSTAAPENGLRPAVAHLFRSVRQAYGLRAVGVLLTGMGTDGAEELKAMKEHGAVTVVQDHDTCVVHGMPGEALRLGAADHVLPPERIGPFLAVLCTPCGRKDP
ncbi:MAG: chemotaxis-specific protein-glutamate methyltransferase CheB [Candidatus Latescibacterota bacterium]